MRIAYFSDVHTEIAVNKTRLPWTKTYPLDLGPSLELVGKVDLCILAGDIGTLRVEFGASTLLYAQQVSEYLACPVVVVPGNHEYYREDFDVARSKFITSAVPNVTVLDRGEIVINGLRVLGATLWTDYALMGNAELAKIIALQNFPDHKEIRRGNGFFTPDDALAEHQLSRTWLLDRLKAPFEGKTLIASHHVPYSGMGHEQYIEDSDEPSFESNCTDVITAALYTDCVGWIYGHNHWSGTFNKTSLPMMSAQVGYKHIRQDSNWSGVGILEI